MSRKPRPVPAGYRRLSRPDFEHCDYFHYSNPNSQNALITETADFPDCYDPATEDVSEAYSDRMWSWDAKRMEEACKIAGGGDGVWAYQLPQLSNDKLREFAKVALNLPVLPKHVRAVHWFNVATGYSCPTVLAIYAKAK